MTLNGFGRAVRCWARLSLVLAMAAGCGSASDLPAQRAGADLAGMAAANPRVFEIDSEPYGTNITEWAYRWTRWE
jgi:hypothetical protein